jgi:hypothetical protein
MSKQGRDLTPDEVEEILGVMENFIAITSKVKREGVENHLDWQTFVGDRARVCEVWSKMVSIIDGEEV